MLGLFTRKSNKTAVVIEDTIVKERSPVPQLTRFKTIVDQFTFEKQFAIYAPMLKEAERATNADALIRQAVSRYAEVAIRQGFTISTTNTKIEDYIRRRLFEISIASNTTFERLVFSVFTDLIRYANAFVAFKRNDKTTSGKSYDYYGKPLKPISGFFSIDPVHMKIILNSQGVPILYEYDPLIEEASLLIYEKDDDERIVNRYFSATRKNKSTCIMPAYDVIHFKYSGDNTVFGRPFYIESLEDLIMLRKMEEQIDSMLSTGQMNATVYYVGNKDNPPKADDMDRVQSGLEWNPSEGVVVIPGHHDVKYLQAQNITQLIDLMNYFKNRFYSGIGLSPVTMGEPGAANRATASVNSNSMFEKVRAFQLTVSSYMQLLFEHLILDFGLPIEKLRPEEFPVLSFPEPDVDLHIKKENHEVFKYVNNVITEEEVRSNIGMSPVISSNELYWKKVQVPLALQTDTSVATAGKQTEPSGGNHAN